MTELEQVIRSSAGATATKTKLIYAANVRQFVDFAGESASAWTPIAVERWRDELVRQRLSPATINNKIYAVKFASSRLAKLHQDPSRDFARFAETVRETHEKVRQALTMPEVERLMSSLETGQEPRDLRDRALITLLLRTGVRREGAATLTFSHYKPPAVTFFVKGERWHTVIIDDETQFAMDVWVRCLKQHKITQGMIFRAIRADGQIGDALTANSIHSIVKDRGTVAGIRNLYPHLLRHTCVSMLAQAGEPAHRIQSVTGHRSVQQVNHYITDLEARSRPATGSITKFRKTK